jgi:hypothetical protein
LLQYIIGCHRLFWEVGYNGLKVIELSS